MGLFGPTMGGRIIHCPDTIISQQQAELFAIDAATRLAVRLGWSHMTYVGDNTAALQVVHSMKPTLRHLEYTRLTRRIRNRLLWSGLTVALLWVPSAFQPADALSRCTGEDISRLQAAKATGDCWTLLLRNLYVAAFIGYAMT